MRRFLERLLNLLRVRRPDHDLAREIDAHLALLQDTYEARGLSPDAARRAARLALGNVDQVKEQHRDARSFRWIEDAWQDAAHGLRLLRRSPVFTATAALSLAIGIGANTAIFTVANALLFRPPAGIADPSELVVIGTARGDGGLNPLNYATYLEIARRTTSLTSVFAEEMFPHVMGTGAAGDRERRGRSVGRYVTANFFNALGASPFRGRVFTDGDEAAAVLDYDYWRRRFNGDDAMVGQVLRINGRPVTIVGVAAPDFQGTGIQKCDVWLAIGSGGASPGSVMAGGRLRPDVSFDTAVAELRTIGQAINRDQWRLGRSGTPVERAPILTRGREPEYRAWFRRRADGAGLAGPGRGLRERRRHHADPGDRAREGDRTPRGARRRARTSRPSTAHRDDRALSLQRSARDRPRAGVDASGHADASAAADVDRGAADAGLARVALRARRCQSARPWSSVCCRPSEARAWMRAHRSRTACGHRPGARASGAPSSSARSRAASCSSCSARRSYASCAMPAPPIRVSIREASTSRRSTRR